MLTNPSACEVNVPVDLSQITSFLLEFTNQDNIPIGAVEIPKMQTIIVTGNRLRIPCESTIISLPHNIYTTTATAKSTVLGPVSLPSPQWSRGPGQLTDAVMVM